MRAGRPAADLLARLGVDVLNRGERIYRLLGCELTYRGGLPRPGDLVARPERYRGALFHGPAFRLLLTLASGEAGASAVLDAGAGSVPYGTLHPALLDAATHAVPHDALHRWCREIPEDLVAYPRRLRHARFYDAAPETGEVRCEARFEDYNPQTRTAVFHLQMSNGDVPWADLRLEEVLLPKGPLGMAPADVRRAFLRDRIAAPGLGLARFEDDHPPERDGGRHQRLAAGHRREGLRRGAGRLTGRPHP